MVDDENGKPEPTQETLAGAMIPVPKREDVERALRKMAHPAQPEPESGPSRGRGGGPDE